MRRLVTRPKSLLLIAALAVVAAMCTISTANAASSASAAPHDSAASDTPCNFVGTLSACESTDPYVAYYSHATGNTSQCTFIFGITWGDGGSVTVTQTDPTDGYHLLAKHTYAGPGVYTITVTVLVAAGNCTGTNSVHTFTLTNPYNCSCVTYVRDTLASQEITLDGGPATASGYTEQWMNKHGWHRVKPRNGTIPDGGKSMVMVWDANQKGAYGDGHMAIVVTAWARSHLGASGKSPWYNYHTKQWNITVLQDDWKTDPSNCTPAQHLFSGSSWGNLSGVNFYIP